MSDKLTGEDLEQALKDRGLPIEGTADEKRAAVEKYDAENKPSGDNASNPPATTTLDTDTSKPSTTAPGDGPADTTDPTEHATSVSPDKAAAAAAGHGTVNAVVPVEQPPAAPVVDEKDHRTEEYEATRPDGSKVTVVHNIDTGETSIKG